VLELRSTAADEAAPMESYRAIKVPLSLLDLNVMRSTAGQ
jgi:hypothetical protein